MNWITCTVATRAKDNRQRDSMPKDQTIESHTLKTNVRERAEEKKREEKTEGKARDGRKRDGTIYHDWHSTSSMRQEYSTAQQHSIRAQSRETRTGQTGSRNSDRNRKRQMHTKREINRASAWGRSEEQLQSGEEKHE